MVKEKSVTSVTNLLHDDESVALKDFQDEIKTQLQILWGLYQGTFDMPTARKAAVEAIQEYFYFGPEGKFCTSCKATKPRTDFGIDNSKGDGLFYWCKECRRRRQSESGPPRPNVS